MILSELFYFDKETLSPVEKKSYDASADESTVKKKKDDTRKTRLTPKTTQKKARQST